MSRVENPKAEAEKLLRDEWKPLTWDKIFDLRDELDCWRTNRKQGGYDIRLLNGAIAVVDAHLDLLDEQAQI